MVYKQAPRRRVSRFRRATSLLVLQSAMRHAYVIGAIETDKDVLDVAHNVKPRV